MYSANFKAATKKRKKKEKKQTKKSIIDILREERKWNHTKCSVKAREVRKKWETKNSTETKNKGNGQKT